MKICEYCQQVKHLKMSINDILEELEQRPIKRYVFIIHDKDILDDGTHKEDHVHIMMELQSNQKAEDIAKWFNDEPQYIEKAKTKGKFAYNNMVAYAFHLTESSKEDGKYKYETDKAHCNFNVSKLIEIIESGVQESLLKEKERQDIFNKIMNNEIMHYELGKYFTDAEWLREYKKIETCYKIRNDKLKQKLEEDREMQVIYFTGEAGTGKTTYAKMIARGFGYHHYITSSGADPLGEYDGQECIILDDLRKENFKYSELLKFMDNNTHSFVKSRYSNKCPYNCKLLIITSILDPQYLYKEYQNEISSEDSMEQLFRRIKTLVKFTNDNKLELYDYNTEKHEKGEEFVLNNVIDNPVQKYVEAKKKAPRITDALTNITLNVFSKVKSNDIDKVMNEEEVPW